MKRVLGTLLAVLLCVPQIYASSPEPQQYSNMQTLQQNPATTAAWTSATAADTAIFIDTTGLSVAGISFNPSGSITGGTILFEGSRDGGSTYPFAVPAIRSDGSFIADISLALNAATLKNWRADVRTFTQVRIRLSAQITGAGTANVSLTGHAGAASESVVVGQSDATKLNATVTGSVNLSQYTPVSGRLPVDGSGVTQPISSTQFPAALVGGRFDVNVGNNPVLGAGGNTIGGVNLPQYTPESGRLPVALTSVPLPTGASTESTLAALNNKFNAEIALDFDTGGGTQTMKLTGFALPASGGAVAGGTATNPIRIDPTGSTTQPVSGTVTANAGSGTFTVGGTVTANAGTGTFTIAGGKTNNNAAPGANNIGALIGVANASAPSWTEGNQVGASFDLSGALRVTGIGGGGTSSNFGSTFPTPGTAIGFSDGTNMQGARVVDLDTGAGTVYGLIGNLVRRASGGPVELIGQATMANSLPVVFASDQSAITVNAGTNLNTSALLTNTNFQNVFGTASMILGTQADALANTSDGLQTTSLGYIFNGSTFDRTRGVSNGLDTTGAGIQAVGLVAQVNDTGTPTITENQFGHVRMTPAGELRVAWLQRLAAPGFTSETTFDSIGISGVVDHDAAATSVFPTLIGGFASSTAPTNVSANGDSVRAWYLLNGSAVTNIAAGGTLITATSNSLNVNFTNSSLAATQSGNWSVRAQDGAGNALTSSAAGATRPLDIIVRDTSGNAITAFGGSGGTASNFGSAFPSSGTAIGLTDGTNMVAGRVIAAGLDTTSNVLAAGLVAQLDDTSTTSVTENQFAPVRLSSRRALLVEGVASGANLNVAVNAALPSGTNNIGDVDVLTVPSDPFGVNADAASATGSISAKLRFIASTGIPVTSLPSNASVNVAQINGVTPLMGNGATGTGSHRFTLANDTSAIAGWGLGAVGSAAPSGAQMAGVRSSANMVALIAADSHAFLNMTTATTTEIVALTSGQTIYVSGFWLRANGTTTWKLVRGTGTNCGTGTNDLTATYDLTATEGFSFGSTLGIAVKGNAGEAVCVVNGSAVNLRIDIAYTKF